MGAIATKQNELAKSKGKKTMTDYVKSMEGEIAKALPSVITPERFTRMTMTALSNSPELQQATPASFLGAMMSAAQLGLEPNTALGQSYIVGYRNKGVMEAQFQLGYKGLIDLAYRSGEVTMIQAHVVYENDEFEVEYGLDPKLIHKPATSNRGEATHVYAMFKTKEGGVGFECMSMDDVKNHAQKYSKAYGSSFSPWKSNFEEMAKKTVLKKALKYAPLKSDFARGLTADDSIKSDISSDMYSIRNEVDYEVAAEEVEVVDVETGEVK